MRTTSDRPGTGTKPVDAGIWGRATGVDDWNDERKGGVELTRRVRGIVGSLHVLLFTLAITGVAFADPLDDAGAKIGAFLSKSGLIMTGLIPAGAGVAIAALAIKRAASKAMGEEDGMSRASNHITEVLKLTAVGTGASLLVAIAGSVLS